jgi:hypothetical protein
VSEHLTTVEARESLLARLWAGECAIAGDSRLAIAGHRLWRALERQFLRVEEGGCLLEPRDLTETLRRRLFLSDGLSVATDEFAVWINSIDPLTASPTTPYITAVEAASFLASGAFLTWDDMTAATVGEIDITGSVQVVGTPVDIQWEAAEQRLFGAHVEGALTLHGSKAQHLTADPIADTAPVPNEFFAGNVTLRLLNGIYDRDHPNRAMYRDVMVSTKEFTTAFLASNTTPLPTGVRPKRRAPNKRDVHEFKCWALAHYEKRGYAPSRAEAVQFAAERNINRNWARSQIAALPDKLRREAGARGATKRLSNAGRAD